MSLVGTEATFGTRLKETLHDRDLTPEQLSIRMGRAVTARTVWRWLADTSEPGIGALVLLVGILDVTSDWLIGLPAAAAACTCRTKEHEHTFGSLTDANTIGQEAA